MKTVKQLVVFWVLLFEGTTILAQGVFWNSQYDSLLFQQRVTSLDEFMHKFNGDGGSLNKDADTMAMLKNLCHICNRDALELEPERWYSFLSDLVQDSVQLLFTDTNWFAIANCVVDMNGKEDSITLTLKVEQVKRTIYKWVIVQASGRSLTLSPIKKSSAFSISPTNNEVNFIALNGITTENNHNILCYANKDYRLDETSVFYALVAKGYLSVKYVDNLVYMFDFPNYTFLVSFFNRESDNAGWLISDFFEKEVISNSNNCDNSLR